MVQGSETETYRQRGGVFRNRIKGLRMVNASELRANPKNWRRHPARQRAALRGVLEEVGYADALIAYETPEGLTLIDGHLRADVTREQQVPVLVLDVTEEEAEKLLLTLDPLAAMADTDAEVLRALLAEVETADQGLREMLEGLALSVAAPIEVEEDEVPEPPAEPVTQPDDLWELGRHRLLCGDCTRPSDVTRLIQGTAVNSIVTDPPYGVDYAGKNEFLNAYDKGNRIQTPIIADDMADYRRFYADFLGAARSHLTEHNTVYIFMGGRELHSLRQAMEEAGYTCAQYLVWVKNVHVLGRQDYLSQHEFILYCWKGKHRFYGRPSPTVLEFPKPQRSDLHPTMKPVALCAKLICDGSPIRGLIYDPFSGSGSVLIAAEQTGRCCLAMEIDPRYCDVIVERWENLSGEKAKRVRE